MATVKGEGDLSARGEATVIDNFVVWQVINDIWNPETNPAGFVNLGVAENALMHAELLDFIHRNFQLTSHALTYGDGPIGTQKLRKALARFVNRKFHPFKNVESKDVIITNGVTTAIESVCAAVADPGEAILLGQPHYIAFPNDWGARAHCQTIPVAFGNVDPFGVEAGEIYEANILKAQEKGIKVRALMLCSPHNPLGGCYSKEALIALMRVCQKHRIHFISDEIYALSVFHNQDIGETGEFISVLSLDLTGLIDPELVHVLWGLSKDFGANGLRVGGIISQSNPRFLSSIDDEFVDYYIKTNQERMSEQHKWVIDTLKKHRIPYYTQSKAAFFIWMDLLTPYMQKTLKVRVQDETGLVDPLGKLSISDEERSDASAQIRQKLLAEKVYIAAGEDFGTEENGWFRMVFTQPKPLLEEGLARMVRALGFE